MIRVIFAGDVSGSEGRRALGRMLGALRSQLGAHFAIVNAENAAGGLGITEATAEALFDAGADVLTLGNHAFAKREALDYLAREPRVLRPANYPPGAPGRGWGVFDCGEFRIAVVNLLGRIFMDPLDCPFAAAESIITDLADRAHAIVVDMHAEATSEKIAMAWKLDGRVAAVIGTHTHVQTSDERILPRGTACITDAGMTGVVDSVLGLDVQTVVSRFVTGIPGRFTLAKGECAFQGVVVDIDENTGLAAAIERINVLESDL